MNKASEKNYSKKDIEKIRKRATEIWKRKCESLNTAIDDWLQAERELKTQLGIEHKSSEEYTEEETGMIRARAQALREEKVKSLKTAFNDWIEAERELKDELKGRLNLEDLFDSWFKRSSSDLDLLLEAEKKGNAGNPYDICGEHYIELMAECMK